MSQAKFQAAKELTDAGEYNAAKAILETMPDDPTAIKWLAKLQQVIPQETQGNSSQVQQWEYMVVGPIRSISEKDGVEAPDPVAVLFSPKGSRIKSLKAKDDLKQANENVAALVGQLGLDGWELVSTGHVLALMNWTGTGGIPAHALYFKRPIQD